MNIEYEEYEICTPEQDPTDVIFRDVEFEIKEILDPGRRRHQEVKIELENAHKVKSIEEIYQLCLDATIALTKYPEAVRASTDLLFYVNLKNVMELIESSFPDASEMESLGWRSVSFIMGHRSCVLTTKPGASNILVKAVSSISYRQ